MPTGLAVLAVILSCFTSVSAWGGRAEYVERASLGEGLHPEAVARALARVEDEWRTQAATFAECGLNFGSSTDCRKSHESFGKSCGTVVDAIVKSSSGDQNRVREYMKTVCGQKSLTGWYQDRCLDLKNAVDGALQFNEYTNRMNFNSAKLCSGFFVTFASGEKKRLEEKRAAEKEMMIKANEQAKVLAEKKHLDEIRQKALEAHQQALEAKTNSAKAKKEAADRLARKKVEAQALAAAAREKVQKAAKEAAKTAEVHRQRLLEHQTAQEHLRNITIAHQKANKEHYIAAGKASAQSAAAAAGPLANNSTNSSEAAKPIVLKVLKRSPNSGEPIAAATSNTTEAVVLAPKKQLRKTSA